MEWEKYDEQLDYPNGMYLLKLENEESYFVTECFYGAFMFDFEFDENPIITDLLKIEKP